MSLNDRLLDEAGDLQLVAPEHRLVGPGSSPVMAAFTHLGFGSRLKYFWDDDRGRITHWAKISDVHEVPPRK